MWEEETLKTRVDGREVDLSNEDDLITECICGVNEDFGTEMVQCDHCKRWFHLSCIKTRCHQLRDTWHCPPCKTAVALHLPKYRNLRGAEVAYAVMRYARIPLHYSQIYAIARSQRWICTNVRSPNHASMEDIKDGVEQYEKHKKVFCTLQGDYADHLILTSKSVAQLSKLTLTKREQRLGMTIFPSSALKYIPLRKEHLWFEVKRSSIPNAGDGLWLKEYAPPLLANTVVAEYTGEFIKFSHLDNVTSSTAYPYGADVTYTEEGQVIYGVWNGLDDQGNLLSYAPLANDPGPNFANCDLNEFVEAPGKTFVHTTRKILPGEEIFICYGPKYWGFSAYPTGPEWDCLEAAQHLPTYAATEREAHQSTTMSADPINPSEDNVHNSGTSVTYTPSVEQNRPVTCDRCSLTMPKRCLKLHNQDCAGPIDVEGIKSVSMYHLDDFEPLQDGVIQGVSRKGGLEVCTTCHGMVEKKEYRQHMNTCAVTALCNKCGYHIARRLWGEHEEWCGILSGTTPQADTPYHPDEWLTNMCRTQGNQDDIVCKKCSATFPANAEGAYKRHHRYCSGVFCLDTKTVPTIFTPLDYQRLQVLNNNIQDTLRRTVTRLDGAEDSPAVSGSILGIAQAEYKSPPTQRTMEEDVDGPSDGGSKGKESPTTGKPPPSDNTAMETD